MHYIWLFISSGRVSSVLLRQVPKHSQVFMFIQFPEPYLLTQHTFYLALLITDRISPLNLIFVLLLASTHEEFTDEQRTQGPSKQNLLGILVS
jgi:hypothetical protein